MYIHLDIDNKKILGKTKLSWRNISSSPVDKLYFHLYYNAFRNTESTFFTEGGVPEFLSGNIDDNCGWGWSNISSFRDENDRQISELKYVQPDDNNSNDKSVLEISLIEPVLPGEMQSFYFDWEAKIPQTMPRTGYNKDYYFFAQWFPKVGVLEPAGMRFSDEDKWNCHQYHSTGEYYSDFGVYNVNLTVPEDYTIAASGELLGQEKTDSLKTWRFRAEDVIDFTWTTSPHYVVQDTTYKDTRILLYTYPEKTFFVERYFETILFAMEYLDERLGTYPYSTLSIVDPPVHGMYTGGMEYPTLITSLTFCSFPHGFKTSETLVTHEYIHQYFMQMIATHEVEEPWMDEGITTYYENRILDAYMGERESFIDYMGVKIGSKEYNRGEFYASGMYSIADNTYKSYEFKDGGYKQIVYNKVAIWLQTLEGMIGQDIMDTIMITYFQRWKFKHPCRYDFIDLVNEVVVEQLPEAYPDGMDWFFDQVIYGTDICDYAVTNISNEEMRDKRGFLSDTDDCDVIENASILYNCRISLQRLEGLQLPVEIEVTFQDGTNSMYKWDGQSRSHTIEIQSESQVISAEIDPNKKIYIDKNFINNSYVLEQDAHCLKGFLGKCVTSFMHTLEMITMLI